MTRQAPSVAIVPARPGKQDQGRDTGMPGVRTLWPRPARRIVAMLVFTGALGACGQKGPLVLPSPLPPPPSMAASAAAPSPSGAATTPRPAPPRTP